MDIAGIDTESMVTQLMALERRPLTALQSRKQAAQTAADALNRIKTSVDGIRAAAAKLTTGTAYQRFAATVSNTAAVSASVSGAAGAGSLTFQVTKLATAQALRSGTVASGATTVTSATQLAVAAGTASLGIGTVSLGDPLATGAYQLKVAVGSGAPTVDVTGKSGAATSTTIGASNNAFTALVDGQLHQITIADGTYASPDALATAVQDAFAGAGLPGVTVTADPTSRKLTFSATPGSSFGVGGGSAAAALGLATGTTVVGGSTAVDVNGFQTAFVGAPAGTVGVLAGAGTLDLALTGPLTAGSGTVKVVSTGDRSLSAVAAAINAASAGVSAAAVNTGSGWLLQLGSNVSGADGELAIDLSALDGLTGWGETSAAGNAEITVGTGPSAYTITAEGNVFTDVIAGVTLTAKAVTTDPVTVTIGRNDAAVADDVNALVTQINSVLADIKVQTRWDPVTKVGGALLGDGTVRQLASYLREALNGVVGDYATGHLPSGAGIDLGKEGSFAFNREKFLAAIAADPQKITDLFVGTDAVPGIASRVQKVAGDLTQANTGLLATASTSASARITRFNEQIDRLEDRLAVKEVNLYRQWSSLQTLLADMQNQGTWLSGQLAGLSTNWGG